jgi:thioredoxin-like negative regulator of GroEL
MKYRVLLSCLLLLASLAALAQSGFGVPRQTVMYNDPMRGMGSTLSGSVRTIDGRPVPNARIEVRDLGTLQVVASGYTLPGGAFEFSSLPSGRYEVVASAGLQEARERVDLMGMYNVDLRIGDVAQRDGGGGSTVSVAQLKIPDKARKALHKAEQALQNHQLEEARKQIDKALQVAPKYSAALTMRGILDLSENRLQQAQTACEQAIRSDSNYAMAYVVLGATYNVLDRFEDALRTLNQGLALSPNSWQGHFEMAKALLGKAQYAESLRQINRAAQLVPASYAPVHLVRAHALLGLKNYPQAIAELEQYLGGAPDGADAASARQTLDQVRAFTAARASK